MPTRVPRGRERVRVCPFVCVFSKVTECPLSPAKQNDAQLYVKEGLVGGVDDVSRLAEEGDLKSQLARAGGVDASANATRSASSAAGGGGKSVQDRCKELIKRCSLPGSTN